MSTEEKRKKIAEKILERERYNSEFHLEEHKYLSICLAMLGFIGLIALMWLICSFL